jgi:hypothetical protein
MSFHAWRFPSISMNLGMRASSYEARKDRSGGHRVRAAPGNEGETYEPVTCLACRQTHFVNRATGRTLGYDED